MCIRITQQYQLIQVIVTRAEGARNFSRPLAHFRSAGRSPHSWIVGRNGVRCVYMENSQNRENRDIQRPPPNAQRAVLLSSQIF